MNDSELWKAIFQINAGNAWAGAQRPRGILGEGSDFFVEMGEGGFQGFAVIGVGGGRQIVQDARSR